jgi:hypothetical protein
MRIERAHTLGRAEAIRKIDRFLEELAARDYSGGFTITSTDKTWNDHRLDFAFRASKGSFGTTISGCVVVEDDRWILESELPALVRAFVGEDRVREIVVRGLEGALSSP